MLNLHRIAHRVVAYALAVIGVGLVAAIAIRQIAGPLL
jgi:hypothetical protein